ncbi:MAG: hypothetical protein BWY90_01602 [Deltaproteobacteria bacterium ADurb.BinA014]|nr:MAG: hypothetical protein BWY90_01602 [Deltaproteobacteria bacterium ADurb.BinA014]
MAFDAAVSVAAIPPSHFIVIPLHVTVLPPVVSCISLSSRGAEPDGSVNDTSQFPVSVIFCLFPAVQSIVLLVPELPLSTIANPCVLLYEFSRAQSGTF